VPHMAPQNQMQKAGTRTAWQFECKDEGGRLSDCGYLIRNHELPQLIGFTVKHVKESHNVDIPESYVRTTATEVRF
jgi:hypothetical protein